MRGQASAAAGLILEKDVLDAPMLMQLGQLHPKALHAAQPIATGGAPRPCSPSLKGF